MSSSISLTDSSSIKVRSWEALLEELFNESYRPEIQRYRSPYVFRGQTKPFPLQSGVQRLGHDPDLTHIIERRLFDSFKKYAHQDVPAHFNEWQWLSMAQHFSLPTRLLDWTFSPFVALHFATSDLSKMHEDGVVWCVHLREVLKLQPPKLTELLTDYSGVFTTDQLSSKFPDFRGFDTKAGRDEDFAIFFEPPSLDRRIVNQVALFSFMSRVEISLDDWLELKKATHPVIYKKVVVPAELKWEIRDKLDQANINERVLFPGLDGLSGWLRRWYSPKSTAKVKPGPGGPGRRAPSALKRKAAATPPPAVADAEAVKKPARKRAKR